MARIAIVGAGPAGAAAGWHLAQAGHAVTLFDRARFPRDKTCGDWLTPLALHELALLGLDGQALEQRAPGHTTIHRTLLQAPDGGSSEHHAARPGRCIKREQLDALIVNQACQAGCTLVQRMVRRVERSDAQWDNFDHLVDARGAGAGQPNAVGVRAYWTVPRDALSLGLSDRVAIHTSARHRRGYGWIFPVSADESTVCFNIGVGLWQADQRDGATVADFLEHFVQHDALAASLRARAVHSTRRVGYPVMLGGWRHRVGHQGVLRIGDAAGLADPLTGDGIGNALTSGRLLAETLSQRQPQSAAIGDAAQAWDRRFAHMLAPELRRAWLLRQLLVASTAKNLAARALAGGPHGLRSRLHGAVFGNTHYRALWRPWGD